VAAPSPIAAVFAVVSAGAAQVIAQVVIRRDGTLQHFGDPSAYIDALARILRAAPAR